MGTHLSVSGARANPPRQVLLRQEPPLLATELTARSVDPSLARVCLFRGNNEDCLAVAVAAVPGRKASCSAVHTMLEPTQSTKSTQGTPAFKQLVHKHS